MTTPNTSSDISRIAYDASLFSSADQQHRRIQQNLILMAVQDILDYLSRLRIKFDDREEIFPSQVRQELKGKLDDMDKTLSEYPQLHPKKETIKYVIIVLIDDVIIFSDRPEAAAWRENPLELEICGTSIAGERLFELLECQGYKDPELAELFFICLFFGFNRDDRKYREHKQRLYTLISNRLPEDERRISPGAEDTIKGQENNFPPMIGYMALLIVFFVSAVCYWTASQWLWHEAAEYFHNVSIM